MTASRVRVGALTAAALLVFAGAASAPHARPLLVRAARHFGFVARAMPATPGQPLASLPLTSLDGSNVTIAGRPGRALVINVFTSWCPSCNQEMPAISALAPALQRAGIDVIGVDQAESQAQVTRFVQAYNLRYPIYIDNDHTTQTLLDARVIPTTVVLDRSHVVREVHVGPLDAAQLAAIAKTVE